MTTIHRPVGNDNGPPADLHGFTLVTLSDHGFAQFLRTHGPATCHALGNANTWYGPDNKAVALIWYFGKGGMETRRYVRADLAASIKGSPRA